MSKILAIHPAPVTAPTHVEGTGNLELLPEEQRVPIPHQALQLLRPAPERQTPKYLTLKTNGADTHKICWAVANSETPQDSAEASV